jgi:hypothetical protein
MKMKTIIAVLFTLCLLVVPVAIASGTATVEKEGGETKLSGEGKTTGGLPSLYIKDTRFEFAPVVEGTQVIHDFIIANQGTDTLKIIKVRTG